VLAESGCIITPLGSRAPIARDWQWATNAET